MLLYFCKVFLSLQELSPEHTGEDEEVESDHEELCHVCETSGLMILCDTCPLSYHFECHNPPLRHAPRFDFFQLMLVF